MMSKVELIKQVTYNTLEKVFKTFDKGIMLIPDDRLDFRPTQANMSAKEISYHVYQVALLLASAAKKGEYNVKDLDLIPFDPDKIVSSREIIQYGQKVKRFIEDTITRHINNLMSHFMKYQAGKIHFRVTNKGIQYRIAEPA